MTADVRTALQRIEATLALGSKRDLDTACAELSDALWRSARITLPAPLPALETRP